MTFNRQSLHVAKLRSTWRKGLSRGVRCPTRWALVGARVPRARLFGSAEIARNPSRCKASSGFGWVDVDGSEVKTTNSHLTLRGQIWYNIKHTLGEGLEIGILKVGYDQICSATN